MFESGNIVTTGLFLLGIVVGLAVAIGLIVRGLFIIHTKEAGVVEKFGKFHHIAQEGLNLINPLTSKLVYREDLAMQLMDVPVPTKTKDDTTITVSVRVQYYVLTAKVKEAYYELDDPTKQIKALVGNVILSFVPSVELDQAYQQEGQIAKLVKDSLAETMSKFGYGIETCMVTGIQPDDSVVRAMNEISAAKRERIAAESRAEATKITMVKQAEAEAEAKALQGQGVARERQAIVDGLRKSVEDFEAGVKGVDPHEVMALVLMTQYFDALRDIGANSNTILLPHSPAAVQDLTAQLRDAVTVGSLAADHSSATAAGGTHS